MPCYRPIQGWMRRSGGGFTTSFSQGFKNKPMEVPCGQCIGCRLEHSRQWAVRIMHEQSLHDINSFVTLTYDNENLPSDLSIHKDHVQKFFKKLRKSLAPQKIRYYACGEYGDHTKRPHYHLIIFNYYPSDSRFYKNTPEGKLYTSETLEKIWGKGFAVVGEVTFETASYTARYVTKKITGQRAEKYYKNRQPEFALMSRRPGVGLEWFKKYKNETERDDYIVMRGHKMSPPRYYQKKGKELNDEYQSELDLIGDLLPTDLLNEYHNTSMDKKISKKIKAEQDPNNTHERLVTRAKFQLNKNKVFKKNTI